jgi:hypothetical protein
MTHLSLHVPRLERTIVEALSTTITCDLASEARYRSDYDARLIGVGLRVVDSRSGKTSGVDRKRVRRNEGLVSTTRQPLISRLLPSGR